MSDPTPSDPTPSDHASQPIDPRAGLMNAAAQHLIPLFKTAAVDTPLAREMAISAMEAYNPETRADFVNSARTIAFSMASLALLAKAASEEMTFAQQMRAYGRANALHRSAEHSERAMIQRRQVSQAKPPVEQKAPLAKSPAAKSSSSQAQIANSPAPRTPISSSRGFDPVTDAAIAAAMRDYLAIVAQPLTGDTAIHHPKPGATPPRPHSHKKDLLGNSSMSNVPALLAQAASRSSQQPGV